MRVAVIGGHGTVAMLLSPKLVAAGHEVSSLIRDPDQSDEVAATGAVPVVADVEHLDVEGIAERLAGHDAVVWCAGAGGGDPERTYAVDRDAAIRSMDAAASSGVQRYVMLSYFGAGTDHGVPEDSSFFPYAEAKGAADAHLRGSGLDWTIVGPSALTDEPGTGMVEVAGGDGELDAGSVARDDVAAVIAAVVDNPGTVRSTIEFNSGSTPIDRAIAG